MGGVRYTFDSNRALYSFTRRTIEWFLNREGKLTYSMLGSRNGTDGTADFSGAMTQALWSAGASAPVASAKDGADIILFQFVRGLYKMDILTYLMGQVQQQVLTHHSMVILLSGMTLLVGMVIF
ncbi:hypothetical protein DWV65_09955 [Limosilactobacillus fermentum]|nr:hypothetical protein DWV65_09955 [Limosilactobacillus fermentum]